MLSLFSLPINKIKINIAFQQCRMEVIFQSFIINRIERKMKEQLEVRRNERVECRVMIRDEYIERVEWRVMSRDEYNENT